MAAAMVLYVTLIDRLLLLAMTATRLSVYRIAAVLTKRSSYARHDEEWQVMWQRRKECIDPSEAKFADVEDQVTRFGSVFEMASLRSLGCNSKARRAMKVGFVDTASATLPQLPLATSTAFTRAICG
jgi:hypothetical protein